MDQNQIDSFKLKRSGKIKENLVDYKYKDISNTFPAKQELDTPLQLDDSRFDKTLINDRSISSETAQPQVSTLCDETGAESVKLG